MPGPRLRISDLDCLLVSSSITTLADLLTEPEFLAGGAAGGIALLALFLVAGAGLDLDWGFAVSAAALSAFYATGQSPGALAIGLAMLIAGGLLVTRTVEPVTSHPRVLLGWILIAIGASLATQGGETGVWARFGLPVLIVVLGYQLGLWKGVRQAPVLGALFAITAFGIWATVPDTETARSLLGAAIPMSIATLGPLRVRLGHPGSFALMAAVAWVAATGGGARGASIVGAMGCVGLIAIIPFMGDKARGLSPGAILVAHAVFVLISSRMIGLWTSPVPAAMALGAVTGVSYFLLDRLALKQDPGRPPVMGPDTL